MYVYMANHSAGEKRISCYWFMFLKKQNPEYFICFFMVSIVLWCYLVSVHIFFVLLAVFSFRLMKLYSLFDSNVNKSTEEKTELARRIWRNVVINDRDVQFTVTEKHTWNAYEALVVWFYTWCARLYAHDYVNNIRNNITWIQFRINQTWKHRTTPTDSFRFIRNWLYIRFTPCFLFLATLSLVFSFICDEANQKIK